MHRGLSTLLVVLALAVAGCGSAPARVSPEPAAGRVAPTSPPLPPPTAARTAEAVSSEAPVETSPPPTQVPASLPLSDGHALESAAADEVFARNDDHEMPEPAAPVEASRTDATAPNPCDQPPPPLPAPGSLVASEFWQSFRTPLPPASVWNPPGQKRVGLQAGHWQVDKVPPEIGRLGHGAVGGDKAEWEVNLEVARETADLLEVAGVAVDVLPATVPPRYQAHAFLSIHADGDESGALRGYKLARPVFSATPEADDALLANLYDAYGPATGLRRDDEHISRRMTGYYAFNSRRYCHAVAPGVPSAILEMGFLTNAADRQVLVGNPKAAAQGIARGMLRYLGLAS